jgi:transposase
MPRTHPRDPDEFHQQTFELAWASLTYDELAQEFEPTAHTIRNWIKQAELDHDQQHDGLTRDGYSPKFHQIDLPPPFSIIDD